VVVDTAVVVVVVVVVVVFVDVFVVAVDGLEVATVLGRATSSVVVTDSVVTEGSPDPPVSSHAEPRAIIATAPTIPTTSLGLRIPSRPRHELRRPADRSLRSFPFRWAAP
jgi:hypothetical protein